MATGSAACLLQKLMNTKMPRNPPPEAPPPATRTQQWYDPVQKWTTVGIWRAKPRALGIEC